MSHLFFFLAAFPFTLTGQKTFTEDKNFPALAIFPSLPNGHFPSDQASSNKHYFLKSAGWYLATKFPVLYLVSHLGIQADDKQTCLLVGICLSTFTFIFREREFLSSSQLRECKALLHWQKYSKNNPWWNKVCSSLTRLSNWYHRRLKLIKADEKLCHVYSKGSPPCHL